MLNFMNRSQVTRILQNFAKYQTQSNPVRECSYKAAILTDFNKPPTVSKIKSDEKIKDGKVRIKVSFCSLNALDVQVMNGKFQPEKIELPAIPGHEFSGEILECGKNLTNTFRKGGKVVALIGNPCGGGLAEQAIVDESDVFSSDNVALKDAAILLTGHGTALLAFSKYCELKENDIVLVTAGPGGMGLGAIEIAASVYKAKVIAICDTEDTSNLIREEGAFNAISMVEGPRNIYKFIKKTLNGKKAKCGVDAVGNGYLHLLDEFVDKEDGSLLSVDPFYNPEVLKNQKLDYKKPKDVKKKDNDDDNKAEKSTIAPIEKRVKHVSLGKCKSKHNELYRDIIAQTLELCEEELISAYVSGTFGLTEIDKAIDFINKKSCTGKVLIDVRKKTTENKNENNEKND